MQHGVPSKNCIKLTNFDTNLDVKENVNKDLTVMNLKRVHESRRYEDVSWIVKEQQSSFKIQPEKL